MMASALACETCPVRSRAACSALNPQDRAKLARIGRHRDVKQGETVLATGDDNVACATLVSGALKITRFDSEGVEQILALVHPAGFVGEMFAPIANHDIVALADSRLCLFSRAEYEAAMIEFPALARALLRRSAEDLFESRSLMNLMGRRSAGERVAGLILAFAKAASDSPCHPASHFDLPLSRGEMAGLVGLTIETVSRQLGRLEADGLIERVGPRGLSILDIRGLEALAT
jgi:CRP/FNR family transcriptional regulator, anaerobic regulatory protein